MLQHEKNAFNNLEIPVCIQKIIYNLHESANLKWEISETQLNILTHSIAIWNTLQAILVCFYFDVFFGKLLKFT